MAGFRTKKPQNTENGIWRGGAYLLEFLDSTLVNATTLLPSSDILSVVGVGMAARVPCRSNVLGHVSRWFKASEEKEGLASSGAYVVVSISTC